MTENTDYTWFQNDINMLRHILKGRHLTDTYSEILLNKLIETFENSSLPEITVPMVRNTFIYDLGRSEAERIANYFEQMRNTGSYEHELHKWAREKGYDKD